LRNLKIHCVIEYFKAISQSNVVYDAVASYKLLKEKIMNVKVSISENKSLKLALRDVKKRFDKERLKTIRNQFLLFSEQFGQQWGISHSYMYI
jgi:hypothetical protein